MDETTPIQRATVYPRVRSPSEKIIRDSVRAELEENEGKYKFVQKCEAFVYHVGMTLFGSWLCPEKHDAYFQYFDELMDQKGIS